eukprot:CAMPEP_0183705320 /NCGR_PEP_ID=MMETSP0737-20130205/2457_1 /TAXON_ID=385413 /ORGANISM="Thalassiosira miniscula, Strain CCMP1093" /LENGTH=725 /DNA_ID=CAMNT_0025932457 /DNA_START=22 /DNA_END=2199 /DNA_ORIENTATION=-
MTTKKRSKTAKKHAQHQISPLNSSVVETADLKDDAGDANNSDFENNESSDHQRDSGGDGRRTNVRRRSKNGKNDHTHKRKVMSEKKLSEEAALTQLLFGGGGGGSAFGADDDIPNLSSSGPAWMDDDDDNEDPTQNGVSDALMDPSNRQKDDVELFAIDRSGEEVTDDVDEDGQENDYSSHDDELGRGLGGGSEGDSEDDESMDEVEDIEARNKASMKGAAWQDSDSEDSSDESEDGDDDDDDEDTSDSNDSSKDKDDQPTKKQNKKGISLVNGPNRLKKLRRYRDETNPLTFNEYELRLRERYVNTASVAARTDWADVGLAQKQQQNEGEDHDDDDEPLQKKKRGYASSSEEESDDDNDDNAAVDILESNASLFASSTSDQPLPPTLLNVLRVRDGNLSDPNNSVVSACQFHPGSDEDTPLLMTAGMDKMLRFFRIDEEEEDYHPKIHGIHFPQMPISCASFLGNSGSVVLSGRRPFFYVYDAVSGKIQKVHSIVGRKERSLEKFTVSPDGSMIAFVGNDGYVILVDGTTRQWIGDLKMNGSVRAVTFSGDGEYVLGSGSDGDVYKWHIGSRKCAERFHNEDGTITSSLAVSSNNFLAVGAESGVVNLYNDKHSSSLASRRRSGLALATTDRTPLKSIMNMTTSADNVRFNHDGQILAMSTRRETNGLKLLHVPTGTVFSNWPTSKTPLKYVWSMDFSPGSRYLAVGNDHGKCLLYRLKHYWDE